MEALVLPAISYSVTDFSADFAGDNFYTKGNCRGVDPRHLRGALRAGARLVAIANSHLEPEHIASINQAIETVKQETGRAVAFPDKRRRRWAEKLSEEFRRGGHAGSYETSLVMAARPELVREEIRQVARASADLDRRKNQRGREYIYRSRRNRSLLWRSAFGLARRGRGDV